MAPFREHPTVRRDREQANAQADHARTTAVAAAWLRQLGLDAGADAVGFVNSDRPALADQGDDIVSGVPHPRTLLSVVCRMHREPVRRFERSHHVRLP